MSIFTKNNFKNPRWWVGVIVCAFTVIVLSPLVVIGFAIDMASEAFDFIHRNLDRAISRKWNKLGKWIKEGNKQ